MKVLFDSTFSNFWLWLTLDFVAKSKKLSLSPIAHSFTNARIARSANSVLTYTFSRNGHRFLLTLLPIVVFFAKWTRLKAHKSQLWNTRLRCQIIQFTNVLRFLRFRTMEAVEGPDRSGLQFMTLFIRSNFWSRLSFWFPLGCSSSKINNFQQSGHLTNFHLTKIRPTQSILTQNPSEQTFSNFH